jgi:CII-binding regulator of phage lambda lysogenization HflD
MYGDSVKKELNDNNHDVKVLREKIDELQDIIKQKDQIYDPEKMIDYENLILRLNLQIKQKDELIEEYKSKIDNYMKNTNVLNFDDKEIVGAVSNVLKEKDQVIQNLKNKIIDYSSGNFTVNLGNNKV